MKIATWNVNSIKVRLPQVLSWLESNRPDVLAIQELKWQADDVIQSEMAKIGFQAACNSQKTYNGVALFTPHQLSHVVCDIPDFADEQKRVIAATIENIRIINAYCVNGEDLASEKFQYKKRWFQALNAYIQNELKQHSSLIVLGDFNIAPTDLDVDQPEKRRGKILCSDEERLWFSQLLQLGLHDSLHTIEPQKSLFTWWDYRMNGFKRNIGMRIDHILLTPDLMQKTHRFWIDKDARAAERPSDHAPVMIEIEEI